MRFIRFSLVLLGLAPFASMAATTEFTVSAGLLAAAKNADIQQVQVLINNGANVNYVDSTGLSLVCTALMNNDYRAAQILQMYGADASQCDRQIKNFRSRNVPEQSGGVFGGLSTAQGMTLALGGAAVVVGGLFLLTDVFDPDDDNYYSGGSSSGGGGGSSGGGSSSSGTALFSSALPAGPASLKTNYSYADEFEVFYSQYLAGTGGAQVANTPNYQNFQLMNTNQNYLLLMRGYSPFARGYFGMRTLRNPDTMAPLALNGAMWGAETIGGGRPVNVALVTANGINAAAGTSLENRFLVWTGLNSNGGIGAASNSTISSKYFNNILNVIATDNYTVTEDTSFDLSGAGTAINNTDLDASSLDNLLAKIVGGNLATNPTGDFVGFMPNGQMTIYRTGGGTNSDGDPIDYYNYTALANAGARSYAGDLENGRSRVDVVVNADVIEPLHDRDAYTVQDMIDSGLTQTSFLSFVADAYGTQTSDNTLNPVIQAQSFFNGLGSVYTPLTIFSTGASLQRTGALYKDAPQVATFENAAPLVYSNLEHLFMSVVAVGSDTTGTSSITPNSDTNANKYQLAQWRTGETSSEYQYYKSRVCGVTGTGSSTLDPWCFAAAGVTDEAAAAAAAGAAGVLQSAFYYMNSKQIFMLLALTADGPYLNRLTSGTQLTAASLTTHLQSLYTMPESYQFRVDNGEDYLDVFKEVFGYGVINLERATTPGTNLYYYTNNKIVSTSGNAYWRAAMNTGFRSSGALNLGRVAVNTAAYDVLESVDGSLSLPRVWQNSFNLGVDARHGLYMGDVLGDLQTKAKNVDSIKFENMSFGFSRNSRAYDDGMGGVDGIHFTYDNNHWSVSADYDRYLTNGESRFYGMANPIMGLATNALSSAAAYKYGDFVLGARAFSGAITDEGLLENDPALTDVYMPMRLGNISGGESEFGIDKKDFGLKVAFGTAHENDTVLGAYATGLMDFGAADTNYVDIDAFWRPTDKLRLRTRATFARTVPWGVENSMFELSSLSSNAFALGADIGNLTIGFSMPLAVVGGALRYADADYDLVENDNGGYDLAISNQTMRDIDISARTREVRLNAAYRHSFGEFTDGAIGFVYRINPNNTDEFGNESIFMMKLSHSIGI